MGKLMSLRGAWQERGKGSDLELVVTHVNGQRLQSPLDYDKHFVHAVDRQFRPVTCLEGDV